MAKAVVKPSSKPAAPKRVVKKPRFTARLRKRVKEYMAKRPHRTFRRTRWYKKPAGQPLASLYNLLIGSLQFIWQEKKILLGLTVLYALANLIVIGGISQVDFVELKDATLEVFGGNIEAVGTAFSLFTAVTSGVLGMRLAGHPVKLRDALYNCAAPLVPMVINLVIAAVQLLPGVAGLFVLTVASQSGALQSGIEYMLFAAAAALLCVLSLYWVSASALALVVVTLPQMYPWRALSTASELVIGQRWPLVLRVGVLTLSLFVLWVIVLIPMLLLDNWLKLAWLPLIPITVQLLSAFTLTYVSVYVYRMYRSLL